MASGRAHDIVLLGASGFTGGLTAEYLAEHAPAGLRWAVAGRNPAKLEALRDQLARDRPELAELPLLHADVDDASSVEEVAAASRVVITTVGPYIKYGEPLVVACAEHGTDYVDLTGEPEFVDLMYVRHHQRAVETGARIVHACGFDSIPHDLGVLFAVEQLPEGVPLRVEGFVRAGGRPSGGTFQTAITGFSRVREYAKVARERRRVESRPSDRRVHGVKGAPRHVGDPEGWALPFPSLDPQIVLRSARALERYGPDFSYAHYFVVRRLPVAVGLAGGVASLFLLAQLPPARDWLLGRMTPGQGPSEQQREQAWFKVRFIGEGGGRRVVCEVSGGDPGYSETSKMLAESAMCLAMDELPESAGQVTTAVAMGDALIGRLQRAGIRFEVIESS